jgi:hypothetical protein
MGYIHIGKRSSLDQGTLFYGNGELNYWKQCFIIAGQLVIIVGANEVVNRSIPLGLLVAGISAKIIKSKSAN